MRQLEEDIFSVDTVDDRGNRILFYMNKTDNGPWTIIQKQPLPTWVIDNEDKLREQIGDELQHPR